MISVPWNQSFELRTDRSGCPLGTRFFIRMLYFRYGRTFGNPQRTRVCSAILFEEARINHRRTEADTISWHGPFGKFAAGRAIAGLSDTAPLSRGRAQRPTCRGSAEGSMPR